MKSMLGTYENTYYQGAGGLVENTFGKDKVYYWGAVFTEETAQAFMEKTNIISPYENAIHISEECELAVRKNKCAKYYFILNYKENCQMIFLKKELKNLYSSEYMYGAVEMKPFEVLILSEVF